MKKIVKIALTGGSCAGKTTGMSWIVEQFSKQGYLVLVVAETATECITGGAKPWEIDTVPFQVSLYNMEKAKEKSYYDFALNSQYDKILIVCDRGALDIEAFMTKEQCEDWHRQIGLSSIEMMEDYDAVFHLVTAAKGAEEYYTLSNNEARTETVEQARVQDDKLIEAWTGHSHFRIIDNTTDFKTKMVRLMSEISSFLGEPEPYEIEKKFLIEFPDIDKLESMKNVQKVEILQTYLKSLDDGSEVRVRQRGDGNKFTYTKTTKCMITGLKRVETEKKLSVEEYVKELLNADVSLHQIRKTRYCISYKNSYLELDVYPFWKDKAILEIELVSEDSGYDIPDFIKVIKDVTEDENYKNRSLASGGFLNV